MTFLSAILLSSFLSAPPDEIVAIKVGRAITVSGDDIEKATILIKDGRIEAIGADVEIPRRARIIDLPHGVAMPGMINCHTNAGLRVPNERLANVPYVTVLDGIDPSSPGLENSRRDGVTVVHTIPSNSTQIGGQGAVIRTFGHTTDELVIKSPSAMKISLDPTFGQTRMGNMAALRRTFYDLFTRLETLQTSEGTAQVLPKRPAPGASLSSLVSLAPSWSDVSWDKIPADKIAERDRPLVEVVRGRMPVFMYCPRASDVFKAFELIDANNLKATLVLGRDGWKLKDVLASRKGLGTVVLDPQLELWETDPETGEEKRHVTPAVLHAAGIPFVLQARSDSAMNRGPYFSRGGEYHLWYQAATLVKFGIPRKVALDAITLGPAKLLGLEHRMGSLDVGKDANISIFSGDPLDVRSWVERVFIEGEEVYRKDKDPDLELLLRPPERPF